MKMFAVPYLQFPSPKNEGFIKCLILLRNKKHFVKHLVLSGLTDPTKPSAVTPSPLFFSSLFVMSPVLVRRGSKVILVSLSVYLFSSSQGFFAMCLFSEVSVFNIIFKCIPFKVSGLCMVYLCFANIEGTFPLIFSLGNSWF